MTFRYDRLLCIDLELTCWEGAPPSGMRSEVVEVGIVEALTGTFEVAREGRYLVRPLASEVGPYCAALTGVDPDEVEREGRPLDQVMRSVSKLFGPSRKSLLVWGGDWNAVDRDCASAGCANPFPRDNVVDAAAFLALSRGRSARLGLADALASFGLAYEGRPHGALADARNTVRLFAAMSRRLVS